MKIAKAFAGTSAIFVGATAWSVGPDGQRSLSLNRRELLSSAGLSALAALVPPAIADDTIPETQGVEVALTGDAKQVSS